MSIVMNKDVYKIRSIEKMVQVKFNKLELPSGKDVCRKQFFSFMEKLLSTDISHGDYTTYLPMLQEKFADVTKEEILTRMAAMEFDRFLKYYEHAEDLNVREQRREKREFTDRPQQGQGRQRIGAGDDRRRLSTTTQYSDGDTMRLFVNLGTKDGFYKASFLQFILDLSDLPKSALGRIDMKEMNSWVEVDKKVANQMIKSVDGKNYRGRKIRMNDANSR
jgi:ATP-dependent RNA helicase DeaD